MTDTQGASRWKSIGTWVGLDAAGVVQAGHTVLDPSEEDSAREFVTFGSRTVLRVGPDVLVRLGSRLPSMAVVHEAEGRNAGRAIEWRSDGREMTEEWDTPPEGPLGSPCIACHTPMNPGDVCSTVWLEGLGTGVAWEAHTSCVESVPIRPARAVAYVPEVTP